VKSKKTMREFAVAQVRDLLDAMVYALHTAHRLPDQEGVHKMRVSIRRFQQALRVFHQYLAPKGVKKVRKQLKRVMEAAGELRNRDIAISLATEQPLARAELTKQRESCKLALHKTLTDMCRPGLPAKWRSRLGVNT
jgi:CHAD domain-containing protein